MTRNYSDYAADIKEFNDEIHAEGVPSGAEIPDGSDDHLNIRVYPQLKPILIAWISNYRSRLSPGYGWRSFVRRINGLTECSGEQPEVLSALIAEFRNLCDLDFESVIPHEQFLPQYKASFLANFSTAISYAAGPPDYDRLRELFFEPKAEPYRWSLLAEYFAESKNEDLPNILAEAFKSILGHPAAHIASLRGFTQFLPQVRVLARQYENDPDIEWREQISNDLHRLEKKHYADLHTDSSIDDLIRDLDDDTVAPYAAYLLGARKDPVALAPLQRQTASRITRLRQEAKTAVKKLEKHAKP